MTILDFIDNNSTQIVVFFGLIVLIIYRGPLGSFLYNFRKGEFKRGEDKSTSLSIETNPPSPHIKDQNASYDTVPKMLGQQEEIPSEVEIKEDEESDKKENEIQEDSGISEWIRLAFTEKDYVGAHNSLRERIDSTEEGPLRNFFRGRSAYYRSEFDFNGAIQECESYLAEGFHDVSIYSSYVSIFERRDLPNESMSIVDRAIQNVPQEDKSKFQLKKAELLIKMKNIEESKSILDILTNDDNAGLAGIPHILLAKIISQQGTEETDEVSNKNDAARDELFKAYKKAPTDYRVLKEGANLLDELGYTKEALFFRLKQNEQFSNSESWALLGNAYLRLSLNGIALEAYLKANDLAEGEEAWILANIGNLYNNRGLHPLAIDYLRKSDALQPEDKYTTDRLAKAVKNFQEESEKAKEIIDNVTIQINKRIDTVSSGSSRI